MSYYIINFKEIMFNFNCLQAQATSARSNNASSGLVDKPHNNSGLGGRNDSGLSSQLNHNNFQNNHAPEKYQYGQNTKVLVNANGSLQPLQKGNLGKKLVQKIADRNKVVRNYQLRSLQIQRQAAKGNFDKEIIAKDIAKMSARMFQSDFNLNSQVDNNANPVFNNQNVDKNRK